jgi:hypothetical protein
MSKRRAQQRASFFASIVIVDADSHVMVMMVVSNAHYVVLLSGVDKMIYENREARRALSEDEFWGPRGWSRGITAPSSCAVTVAN